MSTWKSKQAKIAAALVGSLATYLATTGDIPDRPPDDLAISLKGKTAAERVMAKNFERENAKAGEEVTTFRELTHKVRKGATPTELVAEVSPYPLHWYDEQDSVWRDIDLTVKDINPLAKINPLKKIDKYIHAGNWCAGWNDSKPHDYTFIRDDIEVKYTALFDTTETLRITTTPQWNGIKQTITVGQADSAITLSWALDTNADTVELVDGEAVFRDGEGAERFRIARPTAFDAVMRSIAVSYSLDGDTLTLEVSYPEAVTWPVAIDPTTAISAASGTQGRLMAGDATYLTGRAQTTADFYDSNLFLGQDKQGSDEYVMRQSVIFNTSFLAETDVVDSATIRTTLSDNQYLHISSHFRIYVVEATFSDTTFAAGWLNDFVGWASGSGVYMVTPLGDSLYTGSYAKNDSMFIGLNTAGKGLIDKNGYTKFMLISNRDLLAIEPSNREFAVLSPAILKIGYHTAVPVTTPALSITAVADKSISLTIDANGNGSAATYSIKITHPGGHQNYWDGSDTTATETFKTLAAWGAMPEVINNRLATNGEYWLDVRAIGELADTSAVARIGARAWDKRIRSRIVAVDSSGTNSNGAVGEYLKSRAALSPDSIGTTVMSVGQNTGMSVFRSHFDFKSLFSTANIDGGSLYVYIGTDNSDTDFDVRLYRSNWTANLVADYRHTKFEGWQPGELLYAGTEHATAVGTSGIADPFILVLNSTGLAYYNSKRAAADTTRWSLISSRDCGANEPSGLELIELTNVALHIGRDSTEVVPASFVLAATSTTGITATWTTKLGSNVALMIVDAVSGAAISDTLEYNDTTEAISGLAPNRKYVYKLKVIGGIYDGTLTAADSVYTYAATPISVKATVTRAINDSTHVVYIDTTGTNNPPYTRYAVRGIAASETLYIHQVSGGDDSLYATAEWRTLSAWLDSIVVRIPRVGRTYSWSVKAKSGE